jgi:hypothetical protein
MGLLRFAAVVLLFVSALSAHGEDSFAVPTCTPNATTLCLNGGRFSVTSQWRTKQNASGSGRAVPLTSDTGYFWFFDQKNVEVVVKVLDACSISNRAWVFAAGLSDVEVDMTVTEVATGKKQVYRNPAGTAFLPIQDTAAFVCNSSLPMDAAMSATTGVQSEAQADANVLLLNNRYKVEAKWKTPQASGVAQAVALTADTGYFWFFNATNVEVIVKALDGCGVNNRFWIFAGGLTNVDVEMKVTDTVTGSTHTYKNNQGVAFKPIQDTATFATCLAKPAFAMVTSADDSLMLRAVTPAGDRVEYFGDKNANGTTTRLTAADVALANGKSMSIAMDAQGRPLHALSSTGVPIDIQWLSNQSIVFTATTPDGKDQVSVTVDLTGKVTTPISRATSLPRARVRSGRPASNLVPDFARLDLELIRSVAPSATLQSQISVNRCSTPVNDALVTMRVAPKSDVAYSVHATRTGSGQYSVAIPTTTSPNIDRVVDICQSIAGVLDYVCIAQEGLGEAGVAYVCPALAGAAGTVLTPAAAVVVFEACETVFASAAVYCNTLGSSPGPGAPSISETLCDKLPPLLERFSTEEVTLTASALIPGSGVFSAPSAIAPGKGPFPSFAISAGGESRIGRFTATPPDPAPFEAYLATAEILCAPQSTHVDMNITGTDGYFFATSCVVTGDSTCSMPVPGGAEGVVDTVTVTISGGDSRRIVLVF